MTQKVAGNFTKNSRGGGENIVTVHVFACENVQTEEYRGANAKGFNSRESLKEPVRTTTYYWELPYNGNLEFGASYWRESLRECADSLAQNSAGKFGGRCDEVKIRTEPSAEALEKGKKEGYVVRSLKGAELKGFLDALNAAEEKWKAQSMVSQRSTTAEEAIRKLFSPS